MKKVISVLLIVCILFSAAGCSILNDMTSKLNPKEKVFSIDSYHLQITADTTFQPKTGGSFDLQITNDHAFVSIMAYKYTDLPKDVTPQDVYDIQNEDLFSKRSNVTVIEADKTESSAQRVITYGLYSAERDGVQNYYATYLIDLPDTETFAWVLVTALPSYHKENKDYLHDIACSLTAIE